MFRIVTVTIDSDGLKVKAKLCVAVVLRVVNIPYAIAPPRILFPASEMVLATLFLLVLSLVRSFSLFVCLF